jgi:peptide/nickel transport system permease protein
VIGAVLRRLGWALALAWFAITATFLIVHAVPGDPARVMVGPHGNAETLAQARAYHGLDQPLPEQYLRYLGRALRGDFGESYRSHRAVSDIVLEHIWPTLQLVAASLAMQLVLGVALGLVAARGRRRWPDLAVSGGSLLALAAPPFVVGTLLFYVVGYRWGWLPMSGYGEPGLDRLAHVIAPALALAVGGIASTAQLARAELVRVLPLDFIRTARAKGVGEPRVLMTHALRPALPPVIAALGVELGALLTGAVVVESLFGWPGLGREALLAVFEVDIPLVLGVVLACSLIIAVVTFVVDLLNLALDPRTRHDR